MGDIGSLGIVPIDFATLSTVLGEYKSVKDKIAGLEKRGQIVRLKKGLFVISSKSSKMALSKELIANHLYGPSYISLEYALATYGLIPERVHSVRSITYKRSKEFTNSLGLFQYVQMPIEYYGIGIRFRIVDESFAFLIASPEKAICDMITTTSRLRLQSVKAVKCYLEDDLRIDLSNYPPIDTSIIKQCIEFGRKKNELNNLLKYLEQ
jgi:hypothetical protein